ncbi:MAG TPA: condensation domain-containing protein [Polyangiaceae bacterium]|nr:condensation domain-containing protein [Polyangiaceae bacterium]
MTQVHRELNEIEYLNWCIAQPYNMVVAVEIRGEIEPERLRLALGKAQVRHPLLAVNTELGSNGVPWFTSDGVGPIPLSVVRDSSHEQARAFAEQELTASFERDRAGSPRLPLLRVALFLPPAAGETCSLVLGVQHVIADGLSMVFLVRDLLRWIEDPDAELPVLNAPASADDVLPRTVRRRVSTSPTRFQLVLALATLYSRVRRALISGRRPQTPARHVLRHRTWVLTAEQTTALRARCRREGVSMHAAICTAFLSAFPAVHTPVSLRSFLARPVGESVGLFVGAAEVKLAYHDALGFWTNARRFRRKLRRQLHDPFGIFRLFSKAVPVELVQRMGPLIVELTSGGRPFGITNLGDLDAAALGLGQGRLKIEGFFGAVMGIVDASVVTACTLGGRLRLHLLATELESHETAIRDDCERAVRRLLAAIDG